MISTQHNQAYRSSVFHHENQDMNSQAATGHIDNLNGKHPEIKIRYTSVELLRIFKKLGRFEHPLNCMDLFGLDPNNDSLREILTELTNPRPNVILELL